MVLLSYCYDTPEDVVLAWENALPPVQREPLLMVAERAGRLRYPALDLPAAFASVPELRAAWARGWHGAMRAARRK